MAFVVEAFFSGCISKVVNDGKDYSWIKIKQMIEDMRNCSISTKIYRAMERALNAVTDKRYSNKDVLYEAIV